MDAIYDAIGTSYSVTRCTDPHVAKQLYGELRGATRILNIGAGTGSYEPEEIDLVAVEPSSEMISQRSDGSHRAVQAFADKLPFEDDSFSHVMTVLSMHHWAKRDEAFSEINRIATEQFVAVTWDPAAEPFWLTRDYFPEIHEMDRLTFPGLDELNEYFDDVRMTPLEIPADCRDGFLAAFWKRPEAYLIEEIRQSISAFALLEDPSTGVRKLKDDLASGKWAERNRAILDSSSLDVGYKVVSAKVRRA